MIYTTLPADAGEHVVISHNDVLVTGKTRHGETVNVVEITSSDTHDDVEGTVEEIKHLVETESSFDRIVF
jgi:glycerol dehydrogenase-like iron-containing ADH family enzyme